VVQFVLSRRWFYETGMTRTVWARTIPAVLAATLICSIVTNDWLLAQDASRSLVCEASSESGASVGIYSFLYDVGQLMCVAPRDDADGTDVPCLRIGRVYVGQRREAVENVLGDPFRDLGTSRAGFSTSAYLVADDSGAGDGSYYVIEYEELNGQQIAFSVQLTGARPDSVHHFSCLHLEGDETALRRQLGEPTDISPFEFEEDDVSGVVWSYAPVPISIEVVNGKVYSFRVWRPEYVEPKERRLSLLENR
jgi:hypothetical protein